MANEIRVVKTPFGDDVQVIRDERDGTILIVPKRICEAIGIDPSRQIQILQDPENSHWVNHRLMPVVDPNGRERETLVVPLDSLPYWMCRISPSKVKEEVREKLKWYQVQARDVLASVFIRGEAPSGLSDEAIKAIMAMVGQQGAMVRQQGALLASIQESSREQWRQQAEFNIAILKQIQSLVASGDPVRRNTKQMSPEAYLDTTFHGRIRYDVRDLAEWMRGMRKEFKKMPHIFKMTQPIQVEVWAMEDTIMTLGPLSPDALKRAAKRAAEEESRDRPLLRMMEQEGEEGERPSSAAE